MIRGLVIALLTTAAFGANLDLTNARIRIAEGTPPVAKKAAETIAQEVEKRTQLRLALNTGADQPEISISLGSGSPEGFHLATSNRLVRIEGNDERGIIFGAGYFLRQLSMSRQHLEIAADLDVLSAPKIPIRGHQLGYRPKTNAYDGWSVPMWEQYIRELAIFGTNTIELIPPRSDDAPDSPHFPLAPMDMMVEMSRIAGEYGLNVSVWYPAMDPDYSKAETVAAAVSEWAEVFRKLPRLDAIFVPGGDPGHTEPKYLMALLEKQAASLRRFHPKAEVWISPQSFDQAWFEEFIALLNRNPAWLTGVVFGPQVRGSIAELRARVPRRYALRFYPDITHSLRSEFPVPDWDFAFAATEGRETINPRPLDEAAIFRRDVPFSSGFVTYSEGCNDDVNKFVWSGLGWNPDANINAILADYTRFFFGIDAGQGLLALERNWRGNLAGNQDVGATLEYFQALERAATPQLKLNWRFQEILYRAYYDAYIRERLLLETKQEEDALKVLAAAPTNGSLKALNTAEQIFAQPVLTEHAQATRARVFELAEALFQSIHMQLSVPRYQAIGLERGANLDAIDFALNNRVWLKHQFADIRSIGDEETRLSRINQLVNWTDAGPGGFYDDLGNPARQPHLVTGETLTGFGTTPEQGARTSWFTHAETLGDTPLRMHYDRLDPAAHYKIRIVYGSEAVKIPIRLVANGTYEIHGFREKPSPTAPVEYEIPKAATARGELTLEWTKPPGGGGNGRGVQVAEVWLIAR